MVVRQANLFAVLAKCFCMGGFAVLARFFLDSDFGKGIGYNRIIIIL
jgi:hypothetical protein